MHMKYFSFSGFSHLAAPQCLSRKLYYLITKFEGIPGPPTILNDFPIPVLENARLNIKYFPGFPGPVWTLLMVQTSFHKSVEV